MAFDVEAAKQAGYSQEEIDAFLQGKKEKPLAPVAPGQEVEVGEPPPPTTTVTPAGKDSMMPGLATTGLLAAAAALPFAAGYGVAKFGGRAMDAARNLFTGGGATPSSVPTQNPAAINIGPNTNIQVPQSTGGGARTPAMQTQMQQMRVPPTPAAPPMPTGISASPRPFMPPQSPGIMQQGMDLAVKMREIAAQKVMQNAGTLAKGGAGLVAALTPGNIGQRYNFPTTGPYAGMEINPMTGRPWTPQELQQIR